jgi:hypothetical protein
MTQPREDDALSTPPHGDTLRERRRDEAPNDSGEPASRHGVQLDPRGEPADDRRTRPGAGR